MSEIVNPVVTDLEADRSNGGDDLRSTIANALREHNEPDEGGATVDTGEAPSQGARTPARDQTGKFAKVDEARTADKATTAQAPAAEAEAQQAPAASAIKPPEAWSAADKAEWDKIPPHIQASIARREADIHKGFTRQDEERQFGRELRNVINPYMPVITAEGGNPIAAVQNLLNSAYVLRVAEPAQKAAMIQQLCQQFNVPMELVAQPPQPQDPMHPVLHQLQQQIAELRGSRQQEMQQRQQAEEAALQTQVQAFAADPSRIHFEKVRPHMAALLQSGLAKDLADAYDQAVRANPETYSVLDAQRANAAAEEERKAKEARVAAARNAGSSITGAPGGVSPSNAANSDRNLRDTIRDSLQAARGRV